MVHKIHAENPNSSMYWLTLPRINVAGGFLLFVTGVCTYNYIYDY